MSSDYSIKTICTIGPASEKEEVLEQLITSGMDIARINFSHATYEQFVRIKNLIDTLSAKHTKKVQILMDLQGPRMRVGVLAGNCIELREGEEILFSTDVSQTDAIHINDPYVHEDIQVNHPMFLSNGEIELMVVGKNGTKIRAKVIRGGSLFSKKGINLPDTTLTTRGLTEKDMKDVAFGIETGVDYIALSFVKDAVDVSNLRKLIDGANIKIISKIERKLAISNLDEIIQKSDAIMVARGDLGIEVPIEDVPHLQKAMIKKASQLQKPSIVATQMLMSMVNHPHPTRAEVSDVANAVLDGAASVMLSDETAFGDFPVESLRYLVKISKKALESQNTPRVFL